MNRKNLPLLLMLIAGAATCIITFVQKYSVIGKLASLLFVMVLFYFLGNVLKWTLDAFDRQNEAKRAAEEALLKESEESEGIEKETKEA